MSCPTCAAIKQLLVGVDDTPARLGALTPREREILILIGRRLTNAEIARETGRSINTVNAHLRSIYTKLGATGRAEARVYADALVQGIETPSTFH